MAKIIGLHPEDVVSNTTYIVPGTGANLSMYPVQAFQAFPPLGVIGPKIYYGRNFDSTKAGTQFSRGIIFDDNIVRGNPGMYARAYWKFNQFPNENLSVPLSVYSCRFYLRFANNSWFSGAFNNIITFMNGGVPDIGTGLNFNPNQAATGNTLPGDRWRFMSNYSSSSVFNRSAIVSREGFGEGALSSYSPNLDSSKTWRVEIQVNEFATPKITIKIYDWDSTIPASGYTLTASPAYNIATDSFMLGRHPSKSGASADGVAFPPTWYGDLEVFDTYDMDGTVGQPYSRKADSWHEIVNGSEVRVYEEGTVTDGVLDISDANNFTDRGTASGREFIFSDHTMTNVFYDSSFAGSGDSKREMSIYVPNGTPPSGGWPVVMYIHGGFFSAGSRRGVGLGGWSEGWAQWLLYNGFAVVTIDYVLGSSYWGVTTPPSWPNAGSGRFPSFLVCAKMAARFLQLKGVQGDSTYPINSNRIAMTGHSAGGYIALASALSEGLTNLNGRNLTVSNTTFSGVAGAQDVPIKCAYAWAPPTDLKWVYDNDFELSYPLFGNTVVINSDSFNRSNGTVGSTDLANGGGVSPSQAWTTAGGSWDIVSNAARPTTLDSNAKYAVIYSGSPTHLATVAIVTLPGASSVQGVVAGYIDSNNMLRFFVDSSGAGTFQAVVNGTATTLHSFNAGTFAAGNLLTIVVQSNRYTVRRTVGTTSTDLASGNAKSASPIGSAVESLNLGTMSGGTFVGMYSSGANATTLDSFQVSGVDGVSRFKATANSFLGLDYRNALLGSQMDGARISDIINAQAANKIPPVGIVHGKGDGWIRHQNYQFVQSALTAKSPSLAPDIILTPSDHDYCYLQAPEQHFLNFLINSGMKS
jgi:acetyl esterase/lipase